MVKFSKELEAQLIPEWKEAFVNYCQLKKQIKKIKISRKPKPASHYPIAHHSDFGRSLFDPVRKLARTFSDKLFSTSEKPEILQVINYLITCLLLVYIMKNMLHSFVGYNDYF